MKLQISRYSLSVIPETPQDEAYMEEVLCLMRDGDSVPLVRRNAMGLSCWGHAEAKEVEPTAAVVPITDFSSQVFICRHGQFPNPCKDCQGTSYNAV